MSAALSASQVNQAVAASSKNEGAAARLPFFHLLLSAALWLLVASVLGLIASLRFHKPDMFADCEHLAYGRVQPAAVNALLYGFCIQAGLGVILWLLARPTKASYTANPVMAIVGTKIWNLGVLVGVIGILIGDSTGFEDFEMPRFAAPILFFGYFMISVWGLMLFHRRESRELLTSHWFALTAVFWFAWIFSAAVLGLMIFPVRGITQAVIAWWYSGNLRVIWLGLAGLAASFEILPRLAGRDSKEQRPLALFAFWMWILFASWSGVPLTAPVPAWIPTVSTVMAVMGLLPVIAIAMVYCRSAKCASTSLPAHPAKCFLRAGGVAFLIAYLMNVVAVLPCCGTVVHFTWFETARLQMNVLGFFALTMFGATYYILPRVTGLEFCSPKMVRVHLWLWILGVLLLVVPLAAGGVMQGLKLAQPSVAFADSTKATLMGLRTATMGEMFILLGSLIFLLNVGGMACRIVRARIVVVKEMATTDVLKPAEVKP